MISYRITVYFKNGERESFTIVETSSTLDNLPSKFAQQLDTGTITFNVEQSNPIDIRKTSLIVPVESINYIKTEELTE